MGYPPHLLDELARVFARAALDRLLNESAARQPRQELGGGDSNGEAAPPAMTTCLMGTTVANISRCDQTQRPEMPSKPVNVKQVLIYLTHAQHVALIKLKEKTGIPVSESIRRAIDRYLKQGRSQK